MDDTKEGIEVENPGWFIDEGIPGVGKRPDWLHEKFKSTADLAKSYHELEKRVGTVPDKYDFGKSKYLDPDYAAFQDLEKFAKEKRVPQEFIDKMFESVDKYMGEFSTDEQEEINKLGPDAMDRLTTLNNWAKANLSQDSYENLTGNIRTAEAVQALEELRSKMMSTSPHIPGGNDAATHNTASLDDVKLELSNNLEKYKTDINYRKDLQRRLEIAAKNTPGFVDKFGA